MYYLETTSLSKKYGSKYAVNKVNMHVKRGDVYGLIGPNGAGKTTLMKMIGGFAAPTEGEISLFTEKDRQRRIGILIENPGLYGNMNAYENMKLKALAMGVFDKERLKEILRFVGLEDDLKKHVKHYSLGMKQRLGIALALIGSPDFLILDEPINGLDPQGIIEIREMLVKLSREKGMTILISSHILEELSKVANVFGIMNHGELLMELTGEELKEHCNEKIVIETRETGRAVALLEEMGITGYKVLDQSTVQIPGNTDRIEEISRELIRGGIPIIGISAKGSSLEEFFLDVVGRKE